MEDFVAFTCLFCEAELVGDSGVVYKSGDLIVCKNCNRDNDYDSLFEVAKERAIDTAKKEIYSSLKKSFKKLSR